MQKKNENEKKITYPSVNLNFLKNLPYFSKQKSHRGGGVNSRKEAGKGGGYLPYSTIFV